MQFNISTHFLRCAKLIVALFLLIGLKPASAASTAPASTSSKPDPEEILRYLDRSIDWYQRITALDHAPVDSRELLYRESAQSNARQTLKLAFDFAHAQAAILESQTKQKNNSGAAGFTATHLQQSAAAADQRVAQIKAELNESYRTAKTATDAARQSKLAAELDLATTQRDALSQYASFIVTSTSGDSTLSDKIDQLEQAVPEVKALTLPSSTPTGVPPGTPSGTMLATLPGISPSVSPAATADASKTAAAAPYGAEPQDFHPESAGILSLVSQLFTLTGRMNELNRLKQESIELQKWCDQMRAPIRAQVMSDMRRASSLGSTTQDTTQESDDLAKLEADRQNLETLTADFKLTSSAGIPLGEQSVLLTTAQESLTNWHDALGRQYEDAGRSLLFRTIGTAVVIILLVIVSELWRRATFRYISEPRRRRQLMLVRRIVIGCIVVMIVIGSVVTEFGSLATFAGLITAGIAVALQTVILSGVAYFFFIGRFGVRVGDRVTVSGITGDVVEIGLFRIYLLELAGPITDLHSTGRMIVFSNAVLFQPSAFYKQLPGAEYMWHEIALTMAPETDHVLAEKRLMSAVESVFASYREVVDSQHAAANRILHVPLESPRPQVRLRFVDAGLEMVIRYPVELQRASSIEDQLTRKLLEAIQQEPKLKMVASGTPRIQSAA